MIDDFPFAIDPGGPVTLEAVAAAVAEALGGRVADPAAVPIEVFMPDGTILDVRDATPVLPVPVLATIYPPPGVPGRPSAQAAAERIRKASGWTVWADVDEVPGAED